MNVSRSPHGERGLKYTPTASYLPRRGSLPTRGAWIEMEVQVSALPFRASLPTRGAWIEINESSIGIGKFRVAPHTGSVD